MKKLILLLMVCAMSAMHGMAQDSIPMIPQPCSVMLARAGDTYYLGNEKMNKKQTLAWLKEQDCLVAYDLFKNGMKLAKIGWYLLGTGLLLDVMGLAMTAAAVDNLEIKKGAKAYIWMCGVGGGFELAAVATISTGYYRMHQTVDVFNTHCYKRPKPKPYLAIQAGNNGIGLAYKF